MTTQPHPSPIPCPTCKTPSSCTVHEECDLRPQEASSPFRYTCNPEVEFHASPSGEWVRAKAAQSQLTAMRAERDKWYQEAAAQAASAIAAHDELAALKAAPVVDIAAIMMLADAMAAWKEVACSNPTPGSVECYDTARSALRAALEARKL